MSKPENTSNGSGHVKSRKSVKPAIKAKDKNEVKSKKPAPSVDKTAPCVDPNLMDVGTLETRKREGEHLEGNHKTQRTELILINVPPKEYVYKGIPDSLIGTEVLDKYVQAAVHLNMQSGYLASDLMPSSSIVPGKLVFYTKVLLKPFLESPKISIEMDELSEYQLIIEDAQRDFANVNNNEGIEDDLLDLYLKSVLDLIKCFSALIDAFVDTDEYSNYMDTRSTTGSQIAFQTQSDDESDELKAPVDSESQVDAEKPLEASYTADWSTDPLPKYQVNCDEMVVNTEKYKQESYQMDIRGKQLVDSHANTQRNSHLNKLKSEFKNTKESFAIVSTFAESQSSSQMADNAWVSLYMENGMSDAGFSVSDALSPYIAMGSVTDPEQFKQFLSRGKIPHFKYVGDEGKTIQRGYLQLVDLRVDTEKFTVTGSDVPSYEVTRVALEKAWLRDYPGVTINIKKSRCVMKMCFQGTVTEIERDTGAMDVVVTIPYGKNYQFPLGNVIIELEDSTRRSLYIASKNNWGACRDCGGPPRECRRNVEGHEIWACKNLCFSCRGPLANGHIEEDCLKQRDEDRRTMSNVRRMNNTWLQDVRSYQSKVTDLRKPVSSRDVVDDESKVRAINAFAAQHKEIKSYAVAAASTGKSPNIKPYDIKGEKLAQARADYNKRAQEFYTLNNRFMENGVCSITVPRKSVAVNGSGVRSEVTELVVQRHDLMWRPPAQLMQDPRPQANLYRARTGGRVNFRDSSRKNNYQNINRGASSSNY